MILKLITPPSNEPVTLVELKEHLRLESDYTTEDSFLGLLITAAREYCEGFQNRAYITQVWELILDSWPDERIIIPKPPLQSVDSIKYKDTEGIEYIWESSRYIADIDSIPGRIVPAYGLTWPTETLQPIAGIKVRFTVGYPPSGEDPAGNVPEKVKQAIKLLCASWYENREAVTTGSISNSKEVEFAVHALLWQDRMVPV